MHNKRGAALIMALLVLSITVTIASFLVSQLQMSIERSELNFNADTAYLASIGVKNWAIAKYDEVLKAKNQNLPSPQWPIIMTQSLAAGSVQGSLENAQGRFNLNNLTNPAFQPALARLINYVEPTISYTEGITLAQNLTLWLAPPSNLSAVDTDYNSMNPPYRVAHRSMLSPSELRLVKGFNARICAALEPYIIALPQTTQIDINAASKPVLIAGGISPNAADSVLAYLAQNSFQNMNDFERISQYVPDSMNHSTPIFGIGSNFFYAKAEVKLDNLPFTAYYLLQYMQNLNSLSVIGYSQGTL